MKHMKEPVQYTTVSAKRFVLVRQLATPGKAWDKASDMQHKASDRQIFFFAFSIFWDVTEFIQRQLQYMSVRRLVPVCQTSGTRLSDVWYLSVRCLVPVCQMSGTCLSDALNMSHRQLSVVWQGAQSIWQTLDGNSGVGNACNPGRDHACQLMEHHLNDLGGIGKQIWSNFMLMWAHIINLYQLGCTGGICLQIIHVNLFKA